MDKLDQILDDERYKSRIEALESEDLRLVAKDELKAFDLARKGISEAEPEKKEDLEYLQLVAHGMQHLAKIILERRSKN